MTEAQTKKAIEVQSLSLSNTEILPNLLSSLIWQLIQSDVRFLKLFALSKVAKHLYGII